MNYLVTGGAGFIGSHVVDKLLNLGHKVVVLDNFSSGKRENLNNSNNLIVINGDICSNLENTLIGQQFDGVFHLAAVPRVQFSIANPSVAHTANVNGTHNLLDYCRKMGIKRFIFSSSSSIYGNQKDLPLKENMIPNPMSPYAMHKLIGEQYCKLFKELYDLEPIMLRYFNVYGPRQDPSGNYACLIPKCILKVNSNHPPEIWGDGSNTRDFTYVSDVVDANIAAMSTSNKSCIGQIINIGGGKNHSVNSIVSKIINLSRSSVKPIHVSPKIEPKDTLADITKAKELMNWEPKFLIEKGLEKTYNFFSDRKKD